MLGNNSVVTVCMCVCMCACVLNHSVMSDSATLWTVARQAPLSMGLSRRDYWSGLPFPPPGDLLDSGMEPPSLPSPASVGGIFIASATWEDRVCVCVCVCVCANTYICCCSVAKLCLTLCNPMDCSLARLLCPWDFPGKNTGVGCHFLLIKASV